LFCFVVVVAAATPPPSLPIHRQHPHLQPEPGGVIPRAQGDYLSGLGPSLLYRRRGQGQEVVHRLRKHGVPYVVSWGGGGGRGACGERALAQPSKRRPPPHQSPLTQIDQRRPLGGPPHKRGEPGVVEEAGRHRGEFGGRGVVVGGGDGGVVGERRGGREWLGIPPGRRRRRRGHSARGGVSASGRGQPLSHERALRRVRRPDGWRHPSSPHDRQAAGRAAKRARCARRARVAAAFPGQPAAAAAG